MDLPRERLEALANLRFSPKADERLQKLMDANNDGMLTEQEKEELELLVETSESLSLMRTRALNALGRKPE